MDDRHEQPSVSLTGDSLQPVGSSVYWTRTDVAAGFYEVSDKGNPLSTRSHTFAGGVCPSFCL